MAIILAAISGCRERKADPAVLINTDRDFSRMSMEKGLNAAFISYAADSVVKMRDGDFPIIGKQAMTEVYRSRPDSGMVLSWEPVKAEVSTSGDLGYTFGDWELHILKTDTTLYGNYISIWKKQPDGSWKYVLDAGCNTPEPTGQKFGK